MYYSGERFQWHEQNGYPDFYGNNRRKLLNRAAYFKKLCDSMSIAYHDIKFQEIFDYSKNDKVQGSFEVPDKKELNKIALILKAAQEPEPRLPEILNEQFERDIAIYSKSLVSPALKASEKQISELTTYIRDYVSNINNYISSIAAHRDNQRRQKEQGVDLVTPLNRVLEDGFFRIKSIDLSRHEIHFLTRPVYLTLHRPPAIDLTIPFGSFVCVFNFTTFKFVVHKNKNNLIFGSYYHPYVSHEGTPCLGEAFNEYAKAVSECDVYKCFQIIKTLLTTYNDQAVPYKTLSDFEVSYESEMNKRKLAEEAKKALQNSLPQEVNPIMAQLTYQVPNDPREFEQLMNVVRQRLQEEREIEFQ